MNEPWERFGPYWLQTALPPPAGNGGILGQLLQPVDQPTGYPWPGQSSPAEFDASTLPIATSEGILPPPKNIWAKTPRLPLARRGPQRSSANSIGMKLGRSFLRMFSMHSSSAETEASAPCSS
jgi:hypothetical protein